MFNKTWIGGLIVVSLLFTFIHGYEPKTVLNVTVEPGDTLWQIATKYNTDSANTQEVIYWIQKENNITGADIRPGQVIKVPSNKVLQP